MLLSIICFWLASGIFAIIFVELSGDKEVIKWWQLRTLAMGPFCWLIFLIGFANAIKDRFKDDI